MDNSKHINKLIDEYTRLFESEDNRRRLAIWERTDEGIRGEMQWHGIPSYETGAGRPMPVTAECLDKVWEELLGLELKRFFTEPDYYLEYYLKIKIRKFHEFADDTPLTMDIPVVLGVTHEAGMLGQKVILDSGHEPSFGKGSVVDETTIFPTEFDFAKNRYLNEIAIPFYSRIKALAGSGFRVIFPQWYRGPQGVALYIRGFQEFSIDLYTNEALAHRILRYVTDAAMAFYRWHEEFTREPIRRGDLFNDDIPLMSPEMYTKFFLEYEQEMSDFYGGVYYWHSCGDITHHVGSLHDLTDIDLVDFGVTMESKKAGIAGLKRDQLLEIRVKAQNHVQESTEEESKDYIREILAECKDSGIEKYVLRSSGMSIVNGAEDDVRKLARWVEIAREVQAE